jgi:hypothetical protein
MSKNMVEPERLQTLGLMRVVRWISEAARVKAHSHTHKYVILNAFPRQQWFRKRAPVIRSTYIESLVGFKRYFVSGLKPQTIANFEWQNISNRAKSTIKF